MDSLYLRIAKRAVMTAAHEFLVSRAAKERRSAIWHASLLAFLPPAFVLALGSTLVWAFRGFQ